MKVLFLQIAAPSFDPRDQRSNVPLAAGNLASFANERLRDAGVKVTILERELLDRAGDAALVCEILRREPDVIAASLYCWSSFRTLQILERVRASRPGILTIVGGPEVDRGNEFLAGFAGKAIDLAASGEGEELFIEVLERVLAGADFTNIPGLGRVTGVGRLEWSEARPPVRDLLKLPSPYLTNQVPLHPGGIQHIETARGCVFECDFCFYHADFRKVRLFPRERVAAEIRHALDAGIQDLYLMDPTFNGHSGYRETLRVLRPELLDRKASVHTELRAEPMNDINVRELTDSGITSVEVGLQTITPAALTAVGRLFERDRFANGCRSLERGGIAVEIGTIVGLPHDTRDGMRATFEYAKKECGETADTVPFVLSLLPATVLRERADNFNIRYRPYPPYTLLSTPEFDENAIRGTLADYTDIFDRDLDPVPVVRCVESGGVEAPPGAAAGPALLRRVFVHLNENTAEQLAAAGAELAARVESVFAAVFRNINENSGTDGRVVEKIIHFLQPIREANPHGILEIILELDSRRDAASMFRAIRAALPATEGHYLNEHMRYLGPEGADYSLRIVASIPVTELDHYGRAIAAEVPVVWRCVVDSAESLYSLLDGPFELGGLLIDPASRVSAAKIIKIAGDDAADLRFQDSGAQRALDSALALPAVPPENVAILGAGGRVAAVRFNL